MKGGVPILLIIALLLNSTLISSNVTPSYYSTSTLNEVGKNIIVKDFISINDTYILVLPLRVIMILNKTFYTIVPKPQKSLNMGFNTALYIPSNDLLIFAGVFNNKPFISVIKGVNTYGSGVHEVTTKVLMLDINGTINDITLQSNNDILFIGTVQVNGTKYGFYGYLTLNDIMNPTMGAINVNLIKGMNLIRITNCEGRICLISYQVDIFERSIRISLLRYSRNLSNVTYYDTFSIPCPECTTSSKLTIMPYYNNSLLIGITSDNKLSLKCLNITNQLLTSSTIVLKKPITELSLINAIGNGEVAILLRFNDLSKSLLINITGNMCKIQPLNKSVIAVIGTDGHVLAIDLSGEATLLTSTLGGSCVLSNISYIIINGILSRINMLKFKLSISQETINLLIVAKPYLVKRELVFTERYTTVKRVNQTLVLNATPIRLSEEVSRRSAGLLLLITGIILLAIYIVLRYHIKV
ncbi:MAG: hypothetical protein B6U85_02255 [Desulfurococcales archaeon ex4484_42]|nr:MAG: hypothetical protein B6U85_02255 [Desulfurococcales archaeon ex4484_42]